MHPRLVQRFSIASLVLLLILVGALGIFVYQVSPLRDPSFEPNSGNAGSLLPQLQGITEGHWLQGANVLAALLATNFTVVLYQHSQFFSLSSIQRQDSPQVMTRLIAIAVWAGFWAVMFGGFWMLFLGYLLNQWLVD